MLKWALPLVLGLFSVSQAGLNEKLMTKMGVNSTVILNSLLVLSTAALIGILAAYFEFVPREFQLQLSVGSWRLWYLVPGILGFCLVAGLPTAFSHLGAERAIVLLIVSQIVFGLLWDYFTDHTIPSGKQLFGAVLAVTAAILTAKP